MHPSADPKPHSFTHHLLKLRFLVGLMVIAAAVLLMADRHRRSPGNEPVMVKTSELTITVEPADGSYSVEDRATGWRFAGAIDRRVSPPQIKSGADPLGKYSSIAFDWDENGPLSAEIRGYTDRPAVMFVLTCKAPHAIAPAAFPCLSTPADLHPFGYATTVFSPRSFKGGSGPSPWLLFDDSARAVIISPASNFMTAEIKRDPQENLASGFNGRLKNLPDSFTHQTLLVPGDSIHQAFDRWGHDLTDLSGKLRPANDQGAELRQLGYWTDNGATYYYKFDPARGYQGTLLDVADAFGKLNIPLAYMQLDSWWYFKSTTGASGVRGKSTKNSKMPQGSWNCYGGLMNYTAHPDVFPDGLPAFQQKLGIPLITHNRWIDIDSPYREKYKISGVAAVDPQWWDDIADYLKSAHVIVYEQDWLNEIYMNSPEFTSTTTAGDAFMDNMARATKERGMHMQYCMSLPQHFLQGSKYDSLTSIRVAGDRMERGKWENVLYTSHMAASLGEWPWVDTFNSAETPNLILATLTAGPVGVGDAMDKIDAKNIATCIRPDGVIVKPDTSIVPLDQTYLSDAGDKKSPMIAAAYTDHDAHRTAYVFAFPRTANQKTAAFRPMDLGIPGDAWVYEPAAAKGTLVPANSAFSAEFADASVKKAWSYFVVSPVGPSGIALVGDAGKIASMGKQRLPKFEESADGATATVAFTATEKSVTLHGYAQTKPIVTAVSGSIDPVSFDEAAREFSVVVRPSAGQEAVVRFSLH